MILEHLLVNLRAFFIKFRTLYREITGNIFDKRVQYQAQN